MEFDKKFKKAIKDHVKGNKKIDFIGSYHPSCFEGGIGLFLMKIKTNENGKISGSIEDRFGLAKFEGKISEKQIEFVKKYNEKAIGRGAYKSEIYYHGLRIHAIENLNEGGKALFIPDYTVKPVLEYFLNRIVKGEKYWVGRVVENHLEFKFVVEKPDPFFPLEPDYFFTYEYGRPYPSNFYYGIWFTEDGHGGNFWMCEPPEFR